MGTLVTVTITRLYDMETLVSLDYI